jgi:CRP-like cAMP-binding protein
MDELPRFLQYGERAIFPARTGIFCPGDELGTDPVCYIIAGLVKIEYQLRDDRLSLYAAPDTIFGLVEPLTESARLCSAMTLEKTIVYRWDIDDFFTATSVSWELALAAITGLTRELRILNAEFGERIQPGTGPRPHGGVR